MDKKSELPITLPIAFVEDMNYGQTKLMAELALIHNLPPSKHNIYETGMLLVSLGLTVCGVSEHASIDETQERIKKLAVEMQAPIEQIKNEAKRQISEIKSNKDIN